MQALAENMLAGVHHMTSGTHDQRIGRAYNAVVFSSDTYVVNNAGRERTLRVPTPAASAEE